MTKTCSACKSERVVATALTDAALQPRKGGMMVAQLKLEIEARACLECGNVDLHVDPSSLKAFAALE